MLITQPSPSNTAITGSQSLRITPYQRGLRISALLFAQPDNANRIYLARCPELEDISTPALWLLARGAQVYRGPDGSIETKGVIYQRRVDLSFGEYMKWRDNPPSEVEAQKMFCRTSLDARTTIIDPDTGQVWDPPSKVGRGAV